MNITKRLYTYPVLNEEKDDYLSSFFEVITNHSMAGVNALQLEFDILMNCDILQKKIDDGDAVFLIHIECSTTAFRTTVKSQMKNIQKKIPISRVTGTIEMVAFVIAIKDIKAFKSDDWNDDFENMQFSIEKGSVLAYQNLHELDITKDYEEFSNASSIFMIYKRITNEEKPIEVELESNKIKIGLGTDEYSIYTRFFKKPEMQAILNSMIILPALVFVFEELKQDNGIEQFRNRKWYEALERAYDKRGVNLENEILSGEKKSIVLAQEAMDLPISHALTQISNIYEIEEE